MITYILFGVLTVYIIVLHAKIKQLEELGEKHSSKLKSLYFKVEKNKAKLDDHSSRLWELEQRAGMHRPHAFI